VVPILEARRKQGKYWKSREALLKSQRRWAPNHSPQIDRIWDRLGELGLELDRVRQNMNASEIASTVQQGIAAPKAL
jgi:hypothetical protein